MPQTTSHRQSPSTPKSGGARVLLPALAAVAFAGWAIGCSQAPPPEAGPGPDPVTIREPIPPGAPQNPAAPEDEPGTEVTLDPEDVEGAPEPPPREDEPEEPEDEPPPPLLAERLAPPSAAPSAAAPDEEPALSDEPLPSGAVVDTIVIERGGSESGRRSLVEASRAERQRRGTAAPARVRIDDKNLHEFSDAEVTFAEPRGDRPAESAALERAEEVARSESYWRNRVLELRLDWRAAVEEARDLEAEVTSLRRSFYAEDDPYVRDGRIKPAWDRALDRLDTLRRAADGYRTELAAAIEEGRRDGAQPGWLREGIDLEPQPPQAEKTPHDPAEPTILEIDAQ